MKLSKITVGLATAIAATAIAVPVASAAPVRASWSGTLPEGGASQGWVTLPGGNKSLSSSKGQFWTDAAGSCNTSRCTYYGRLRQVRSFQPDITQAQVGPEHYSTGAVGRTGLKLPKGSYHADRMQPIYPAGATTVKMWVSY